MSPEQQLVAACLASVHPLAVTSAAGDVLATSKSFPLTTARLEPADAGIDFIVIDIAGLRLWVATPLGETRGAIELLSTSLRRQGATVQRHSQALSSAANEIDTLSLLGNADRLLASPDTAGLDAVAELLQPRLRGTTAHFSLEVGSERHAGSRPNAVGSRTVELQRSAVTAQATVSGPLDAGGEALLRGVLERLVSAGERHALELARLRTRAAEEATEIAGILAHELNSPIAALGWALASGLASLTEHDEDGLREALDLAQTAVKRLERAGSELRLIGLAEHRYRRMPIHELLGWFDRHRHSTTTGTSEPVAIIGDPAVVGPALEELGRGFADAEASFLGVSGEVALLHLKRATLIELSPLLRACGITLTATGDVLELAIPFRLIAV